MRVPMNRHPWVRDALLVLLLAALALALLTVRASPAAEIVPSLGLTKPANGGGDARLYTGLALRNDLAPLLMGEIGVAYRSESRFNDQLRVRSWPVTASLYLKPGPFYAGAGVGWYQTTFAYPQGSLLADETKQEFGVHAGGGLELPLGPGAGLDLNGRYVMMRDQRSRLVPETFDPDFWTLALGLAMHF